MANGAQQEPGTGAPIFTLFVYVAREDTDTTVVSSDKHEVLKWLQGCDQRCAISLALQCAACLLV